MASKWPKPWRSAFFVLSAKGDQTDLLATQLDLKLIAGLEIKHGRVGLAHHQVAIELNLGIEAELATSFTSLGSSPKVDAFGIEKRLIEGREIQPFASVPLGGDVASGPDEIRLADIPQLLDLGQEIGASEHVVKNATSAFSSLRGICASPDRLIWAI